MMMPDIVRELNRKSYLEGLAVDQQEEINELKAYVASVYKAVDLVLMDNDTSKIKGAGNLDLTVDAQPKQCLANVRADAISGMIGNMPSAGFNSDRDRNNWIGDYIYKLREQAK
ncbi:MAG: hypothetical protein HRU18_16795 [Pseudoalteromonas sp.]|uniref:hypothetical protein n=1 Tax=Pseudoalteromonas sp. TaxID=53249 RepID=UPI001DFE6A43|nr:hypothetical protein [Pseudoalteromonas sp.]NRA79865.1 hypothetical protein [Pseudoalteromonas sp.]